MTLYGMLSTRASERYTTAALTSLFEHTALSASDRVIVVDNDGSYAAPAALKDRALAVLRPPAPQSFARNANVLIREAAGAHLLLLNNDLLFTPGWADTLVQNDRAIQSPFSNAQSHYRTPTFDLRPALTLDEFQGHTTELLQIAAEHRTRAVNPFPVLVLPFFCVSLPAPVYTAVGLFDESYGPAGGEDYDYCIRSQLAGFPVQFAARSFVLHFGGQATWAGPEDTARRAARETRFVNRFRERWGENISRLVFGEIADPLAGQPHLQEYARERKFGDLLRALHPSPAKL